MAKAAEAKPEYDPRRTVDLDAVLGHDASRAFLRRAWEGGRLPQVLLFTGPAGIGKTTLAWALARHIISGVEDPARAKYKFERHVHPDVIELTGKASVSSQITVEEVRGMEDRAWTSPLESPRKLILVEPAERLNVSAANCLLKLLEEPPPSLQFFLIAAEPARLLPTIRSRSTPVPLEPVAAAPLNDWLKTQCKLTDTQAKLIAGLAEGRPGYALRMARSRLLEQRREILQELTLLSTHGFATVFRVADRLAGMHEDLAETFGAVVLLLRDALVLGAGGGTVLNEDLRETLEELGRRVAPEGVLNAAEAVEAAIGEAPYFYGAQARTHFVEWIVTQVGRHLRATSPTPAR